MDAKIVLLDDNKATNYIHRKFIQKVSENTEVVDFQVGQNALDYLREEEQEAPYFLFMDINMPTMNAWEFLEHFSKIKNKSKENSRIYLLTTSMSPHDAKRMEAFPFIVDMLFKPLDVSAIQNIYKKWNIAV